MNNIKQTKKAREYSTASEGQQDSYMDQMCDLTTNVMWSPSCVSTLCVVGQLLESVGYIWKFQLCLLASWLLQHRLVVASVMSALLCILS